jgi:hypothetical protein
MAKARQFVRADRELKGRVAKLHERLLATQEDFHLTPEHILTAVKTGLALAGRPPLEIATLADAPAGAIFRMPSLSGSWARCLEGLRHPHTKLPRPITFDHAVAKGRDDVVLVHLNHRLVQMCLRLLRAEVWAQDDVKKLHRVTVRTLPDGEIEARQVERLKEMGAWVSKNSDAIYGTRGGPWKPSADFVSTRKGDKIYLHLLKKISGPVTLPTLPVSIKSAKILNGAAIQTETKENQLTFQIPENGWDPIDTIVELTLTGSVIDIAPINTDKPGSHASLHGTLATQSAPATAATQSTRIRSTPMPSLC